MKEAQESKCTRGCARLVKEEGRQDYCAEMREILDIANPDRLESVLQRCSGPYKK